MMVCALTCKLVSLLFIYNAPLRMQNFREKSPQNLYRYLLQDSAYNNP